jgi:hypothetical protein
MKQRGNVVDPTLIGDVWSGFNKTMAAVRKDVRIIPRGFGLWQPSAAFASPVLSLNSDQLFGYSIFETDIVSFS